MHDDDALWNAIEEIEVSLGRDDLVTAREVLVRAKAIAGEDDPDVCYAEACIIFHGDGPQAATPLLERVVELDDSHADAHYALAQAAEERGDRDGMSTRFLRVQALDAQSDRAARVGSAHELDHVERTARRVLAELPSPFLERLAHVPVVLERRPSRALVRDGFDPRALGLFEGAIDGDRDTPAPTRIVLFVNNLLADFPHEPELSEEIEITLLHEIGHYFGLDEDDMLRLGLD
jgi:predicted Zn-dependent protease with MMP-like domain